MTSSKHTEQDCIDDPVCQDYLNKTGIVDFGLKLRTERVVEIAIDWTVDKNRSVMPPLKRASLMLVFKRLFTLIPPNTGPAFPFGTTTTPEVFRLEP